MELYLRNEWDSNFLVKYKWNALVFTEVDAGDLHVLADNVGDVFIATAGLCDLGSKQSYSALPAWQWTQCTLTVPRARNAVAQPANIKAKREGKMAVKVRARPPTTKGLYKR